MIENSIYFMDKHAEVTKNKIIEWCKTDGISCKEIQPKEGSQMIFELQIGTPPVIVYIQQKYPDRIYFQQDINIGKDLETLVNEKWEKSKKINLVLTLQINSATFNIRNQILGGERITGLRQFLFHANSSFEKHDFLSNFSRVQEIHMVTMNILSVSLGAEMNSLKKAQDVKNSDNPLAN